jgi:hypothetical protein
MALIVIRSIVLQSHLFQTQTNNLLPNFIFKFIINILFYKWYREEILLHPIVKKNILKEMVTVINY